MSIHELEGIVAGLKAQKDFAAHLLREVEANLCAAMLNLTNARNGQR